MDYPLIKPKYYVSLLKDITTFIKKPHCQRDLNKSVKFKVYDTIGLFILKMIFLIPLLFFFALVYDPENIQSESMAKRFSPIVLLLVGGFVLPFVEEVAFRLSLKFNSAYLAFTSSALVYYFLSKAVFQTKISAVDESFLTRIILAISFGFIFFSVSKYQRSQ